MKFFIYNPGPMSDDSNPPCYRFHANTGAPSHIFECYKKFERLPINFQCSDRVLQLSKPHPRHLNKKYEKELRPWRGTYVSKKVKISSRLDHLAAPIFRRVFTTRRHVESNRNVNGSIKENLNLQIQRSMYNIYSRLQNVKFRNILDPKRKSIKPCGEDYENRLKIIERLSQPRKIPTPELPAILKEMKRPINMEAIIRLSIPRKCQPAEPINHPFLKRPLKGSEYYEKLSQPKKNFEDIFMKHKKPEPKLTSMKRTEEIAIPLPRLQRRKFMKGDNEKFSFPVSKAALQYKASAKINKLAVPKTVHEDSNQSVRKSKK